MSEELKSKLAVGGAFLALLFFAHPIIIAVTGALLEISRDSREYFMEVWNDERDDDNQRTQTNDH